MPKKNPEREANRERRKELLAMLESAGITDTSGVQELYKEILRRMVIGAKVDNNEKK